MHQLDLVEKSTTPLATGVHCLKTENRLGLVKILSRHINYQQREHVCDSFKTFSWSVLYYGSSLGARWAAKSLRASLSMILG